MARGLSVPALRLGRRSRASTPCPAYVPPRREQTQPAAGGPLEHDATMFPGVVKKNDQGEFEALEFDRILADVPCTGDGTMRKNYDIWSKWTPENSLSVHATQIKILKRALELLKVGGKVVYSTCSMSPLEDEAVVAHVLSQTGASAELVDCSSQLPNLKRRKGVSSWKVQLRDFSWYRTVFRRRHENCQVLT